MNRAAPAAGQTALTRHGNSCTYSFQGLLSRDLKRTGIEDRNTLNS